MLHLRDQRGGQSLRSLMIFFFALADLVNGCAYVDHSLVVEAHRNAPDDRARAAAGFAEREDRLRRQPLLQPLAPLQLDAGVLLDVVLLGLVLWPAAAARPRYVAGDGLHGRGAMLPLRAKEPTSYLALPV